MKKKVKPCNIVITSLCCFAFVLLIEQSTANAAVSGANQAAAVLCDVILIIRGRIGRALSLIAIMTTAWGFMNGNTDWKRVSTLAIGFGLLFGAEGFAYVILPSTVQGITGVTSNGAIFNPQNKYTPEEIVKSVCPELSRFG
ncbi:MAG: TrbC/VirB2 family protein [Alphaproteobacteria bacterium]|nr:TrbC/VirB2 family protein [Rickettsiales bacterium]